MTALSQTIIRDVEARSTGKPYPVYVKNMKGVGISRYKVFVCNHDRTFYKADGEQLEIPGHAVTLTCAERFDLAKTKEAIRRTQQGLTDYSAFLKEIAEAGVHTYVADLEKMEIIYNGMHAGEKYTEKIPEV